MKIRISFEKIYKTLEIAEIYRYHFYCTNIDYIFQRRLNLLANSLHIGLNHLRCILRSSFVYQVLDTRNFQQLYQYKGCLDTLSHHDPLDPYYAQQMVEVDP